MAKGKKYNNSNSNNIKAYRHEKETRKNAVPIGIASYDTSKPKPKKYEYDPHLDSVRKPTGAQRRGSHMMLRRIGREFSNGVESQNVEFKSNCRDKDV